MIVGLGIPALAAIALMIGGIVDSVNKVAKHGIRAMPFEAGMLVVCTFLIVGVIGMGLQERIDLSEAASRTGVTQTADVDIRVQAFNDIMFETYGEGMPRDEWDAQQAEAEARRDAIDNRIEDRIEELAANGFEAPVPTE
jgi:hypothetical protein